MQNTLNFHIGCGARQSRRQKWYPATPLNRARVVPQADTGCLARRVLQATGYGFEYQSNSWPSVRGRIIVCPVPEQWLSKRGLSTLHFLLSPRASKCLSLVAVKRSGAHVHDHPCEARDGKVDRTVGEVQYLTWPRTETVKPGLR